MKKILIAFILSIFLISFVSALDYSVDNYKIYNSSQEKIEIWDSGFLGLTPDTKLAEAQLITPRINKVLAGNNRLVFEFEYDNLYESRPIIEELELYDLKTNERFEKRLTWKYAILEEIWVERGSTECDINNENCIYNNQSGYEIRKTWHDFSENQDFPIGKIMIGGFTDVHKGETTEWIIKSYGQRLTEWATWTDSFNQNLTSYWNFDMNYLGVSNSTFAEDVYKGINNATVHGAVNGSTGIHNQSYYFDGLDSTKINVTDGYEINSTISDSTVSIWVYPQANTTGMYIAQKGYNNQWNGYLIWLGAGDSNKGSRYELWFSDGATFNTFISSANVLVVNNTWTHILLRQNATAVSFWVNGTQIASDSTHRLSDHLTSPLIIANANTYATGSGWLGKIDEVSVWNRSLSNSEIATLYDTGSGTFYAPNITVVSNPVSIGVTLLNPANNSNFTSGASRNFNATLSPTNGNTTNATLYIWNSAGAISIRNINTSVFNTTLTVNVSFTNTSIADGNYSWNVQGCAINFTGASDCAFASNNWTFKIDSSPPVVSIIQPVNNSNITYHLANTNLTLNFSISDLTGLSTCWYEFGGANTTTSCTQNVSFNATDYGTRKITLYANDTYGNLNSTTHIWNYTIWQTANTYNSPIPMGSSQTFFFNITANPSVTAINFTYNATTYTASFSANANNYSASYTLVTPTINYSSMLIPFYWTIYSSNGNAYNSSSNNQNVTQITVDDCSTNGIVLYNFTIKDEAVQYTLNATANNTRGKIDLQIYPVGSASSFIQFNKTYNQTNPFSVCLNQNLSNAQYNIYAILEYGATNYQTEFYNIQNATLNNTLLYQNITLYDLLTTSAQSFKLVVKDTSFVAIKDAIIEVYRKYIDEGIFKIVEIPKTDPAGETTASLVINDVIYKFIIKKYGHIISTFSEVRAICQNPSLQTCKIDFNAFESGIEVPDYEQEEDFNFTLGYNKSSRVVTSRFLIPSGTTSIVRLNVTIEDALGTQACSDSITSTTGTLSCTIPQTLGNMSAFAKIYRDEQLQASGSISQSQSATDIYGSAQVFLALIIMLTLIGASISSNPVFTVLFFMVGVIFLFALHIIENNGFIGATATILWLIVAIIIVIIKGAKRN